MGKYKLAKADYLLGGFFFFTTVVLHWRLHPDLQIILYFLGSVIGLHLLEALDSVFKSETSAFRNILVQAVLWVLAFFTLTSSTSLIGKGVVLFLNLRLFDMQINDWKKTKALTTWFAQAGLATDQLSQQIYKSYVIILTAMFVGQILLFILI